MRVTSHDHRLGRKRHTQTPHFDKAELELSSLGHTSTPPILLYQTIDIFINSRYIYPKLYGLRLPPK